jgi:hypothetical protein
MANTSLIDNSGDFLPGLMPDDMPKPMTQEEFDAMPIYTAEQLFKNDERRYRLAVALFFGLGSSFRQACDIARVGYHTMQAIIKNEVASTTAEQWRQAASGEIRALTQLAMAAASQLLTDPKAIEAAKIQGVATILRELTHAHEMLNQRLPGQGESKKLTPEEMAELYTQSLKQARGQSIEATEMSEATRGADGADPEDCEASND